MDTKPSKNNLKIKTVKSDHLNTYYFLGKNLHREDGPAIEKPDGTGEWYYYGTLHDPYAPPLFTLNSTYLSDFANRKET